VVIVVTVITVAVALWTIPRNTPREQRDENARG
jgi:hypothetical protein